MLDIIEIDAASNTWVDNIRELIERARFEPNQGKYKVYIIDEVHMLSTPAFNALLKTLEEPPSHVKFILATTEIDSVPETIRSRSLRFDFRKIGYDDIVSRLEYVTKTEEIAAEKEALQIIAKSARGWLRDALTLLEQNVIDSTVSTDHVRHTLSLLEDELIDTIISTLESHDASEILAILDKLRDRHIQARSFFDQLMYRLRDLMVEHIADELFYVYHDLFSPIQDAYTKIRNIPDGMMLIEITLLKIAKWEWKCVKAEEKIEKPQIQKIGGKIESSEMRFPSSPQEHFHSPLRFERGAQVWQEPTISGSPTLQKWHVTITTKDSIPQELEKTPTIEIPKKTPIQETKKEEALEKIEEIPPSNNQGKPFSFPAFIMWLKATTLMTDVKGARFELKDTDTDTKTLHLIFSKKWNFDRVNIAKSKNILVETLQNTFGGNWSLECTLQIGSDNTLHNAVHEIF